MTVNKFHWFVESCTKVLANKTHMKYKNSHSCIKNTYLSLNLSSGSFVRLQCDSPCEIKLFPWKLYSRQEGNQLTTEITLKVFSKQFSELQIAQVTCNISRMWNNTVFSGLVDTKKVKNESFKLLWWHSHQMISSLSDWWVLNINIKW